MWSIIDITRLSSSQSSYSSLQEKNLSPFQSHTIKLFSLQYHTTYPHLCFRDQYLLFENDFNKRYLHFRSFSTRPSPSFHFSTFPPKALQSSLAFFSVFTNNNNRYYSFKPKILVSDRSTFTGVALLIRDGNIRLFFHNCQLKYSIARQKSKWILLAESQTTTYLTTGVIIVSQWGFSGMGVRWLATNDSAYHRTIEPSGWKAVDRR